MQIAELLKKFTSYDFSIRNESGIINMRTTLGKFQIESMVRASEFKLHMVSENQIEHIASILEKIKSIDRPKIVKDANS